MASETKAEREARLAPLRKAAFEEGKAQAEKRGARINRYCPRGESAEYYAWERGFDSVMRKRQSKGGRFSSGRF